MENFWNIKFFKDEYDIIIENKNKLYNLNRLVLYISPFLKLLISDKFDKLTSTQLNIDDLELSIEEWELFLNVIYYLYYIKYVGSEYDIKLNDKYSIEKLSTIQLYQLYNITKFFLMNNFSTNIVFTMIYKVIKDEIYDDPTCGYTNIPVSNNSDLVKYIEIILSESPDLYFNYMDEGEQEYLNIVFVRYDIFIDLENFVEYLISKIYDENFILYLQMVNYLIDEYTDLFEKLPFDIRKQLFYFWNDFYITKYNLFPEIIKNEDVWKRLIIKDFKNTEYITNNYFNNYYNIIKKYI